MSILDDLNNWKNLNPFGQQSVPFSDDPSYHDLGTRAWNWLKQDPGADAERARRAQLYGQAATSGQFADRNEAGFAQLGAQGRGALAGLQRQAQGKDSVSAQQLRQGLEQMYAQQLSQAAGASPQNAAGAARTAAIQMGRAGQGMAGQQAIAGLQERQQAQQAYANLLQGLRQQELNAALGGRQTAVTGYGAANAGEREKSNMEKYGPAIAGGLGALFSDRRLKTDIKPGGKHAEKVLDGLKSYTYSYKDQAHGAGQQFGPMAQDLEKAGLRHAVIDTPAGKMVHGAKLATSLAALMPNIHERLSKLEGKGK